MKRRVLFVVIPEKGHINPMIGVAQCMYKMNTDVAFFSQVDVSNQLKKANIFCKCYSPLKNPKIPDDLMVHGEDFAIKLKDKIWMQKWIKALLIDSVPNLVLELERVIKKFKPDIIVSDPMIYATAIVAENKNIPWVGISNSLNPLTPKAWKSDLIETLNKFHSQRLALFSSLKRDLDFRVADLISPWFNTVYTSEAYIPRDLSNNNVSIYAGKSFLINENRGDETNFPFEKLEKGKKKVYMSLGSMVYYHPILFETVAKALDGLNVQLILSVGGLCNSNFIKKFPDNAIISPYVPQLKLLKHIDIMVSHGGSNSVTECLSSGIPLALLPICNDQFFQAKFLKKAKAGIILDTDNPSQKTYRKKLIELLKEDNIYKKNAQLIKKSFNNYGGPKQVTDLIYKILKTGKPIKLGI